MSKIIRRRKVQDAAAAVKKRNFKLQPDHVIILITLILAGLPFCLGKYIEFNTPGPFDSGAYVYSAKHILSGARIGVDEMPSARPGTMLMNIIGVKLFGFSEFGPKFMQGILQAAGIIMLFVALKKLFGNLSACIGALIASFYLSAPVIAKYGNVKEQFMIGYMLIGGSCFILYHAEKKWWWMLLSGMFIINAPYCKATGISVIISVAVYQLYQLATKKADLNQLSRQLGTWLAGAAIGMVPLLILYGWQGQLSRLFPPLIFSVLLFVLMAGLLISLVYTAILWLVRHGGLKQLKSVRRRIWIGSLSALLIVFIFSVGYVKIRASSILSEAGMKYDSEVTGYLQDTPYVILPSLVKARFTLVLQDILSNAGMGTGYLAESRSAVTLSQQAPRILRYYKTLCVPVIFGLASAVLGLIRFIKIRQNKSHIQLQDKMLIFLLVWWILDMALVWVSPRPYEQYYLPLNASAAMLSGYVTWLYSKAISAGNSKGIWIGVGSAAAVLMIALGQHIFFGLRTSPYSGTKYKSPKNGYVQRLESVADFKKGNRMGWQVIGDLIKAASNENDRIYVWGWYPGIYVQAQRLSDVPKAYESNMHVTSPAALKKQIDSMVEIFKKSPPKFIVDSRKVHFPNDRPPLELWPITKKGPIPDNPQYIEQFDRMYMKMLAEIIPSNQLEPYRALSQMADYYPPWIKAMPDEALRYEAMKPLREFIRKNYRIVPKNFGLHILFERAD